jgi:transcriptional regulator with XRE-family HTH domain
MTLIDAVTGKRVATGLSYRGLAKLTGISFSTLARLERCGSEPDEQTCQRLKAWLREETIEQPSRHTVTPKTPPWRLRVERRLAMLEANVRQLTTTNQGGETNQ